jgi:hypothetical protein
MKAIINLDLRNGASSLIIVEHETIAALHSLVGEFNKQKEIQRATILTANVMGRVVTMEAGDSIDLITRLASDHTKSSFSVPGPKGRTIVRIPDKQFDRA